MSALRQFYERLYGWLLVNILHRGRLTMGRGSVIEPGVFIARNGRIKIGDNTRIRTGTIIMCQGGTVEIGSEVTINQRSILHGYGDIYIGDCVLIAPEVAIFAGNHEFADPAVDIRKQGMTSDQPIRIGRNVWLGTKCVVVDGVEIGEDSVIGAASVITRSISAKSIAVGNPARVIRSRGSLSVVEAKAEAESGKKTKRASKPKTTKKRLK